VSPASDKNQSGAVAEINPFSTRFVRPGAIPFLAGENVPSPTVLPQRLARQQYWGAIVGPHGSGKTTLLYALADALRARGRELVWVTLQDGQRHLPAVLKQHRHWHGQTQVIVDGYEQLGPISRRRLKWASRKRGAGLLVTSHQPVAIPTIFETRPTLRCVERIVAHLLGDREQDLFSPALLADCYARHGGDVREILFELYDRYEALRR